MAPNEISRLDSTFALLLSAASFVLLGALSFALYAYWAWPQPTDNQAMPILLVVAIVASARFVWQAAFLTVSVLFGKSRGLYFDGACLVLISPHFRAIRSEELVGVKIVWTGGKRSVKWEYVLFERRGKPAIRVLARLLRQPSGQVIERCKAVLTEPAP